MYASNRRAKEFLFDSYDCDEVWFKPHTKRKDRVFTKNSMYKATDLFNLFDGIAIAQNFGVIFFQVKTNAWPSTEELNDFVSKYPELRIIALNVRKKKNSWEVFSREYPYERQ